MTSKDEEDEGFKETTYSAQCQACHFRNELILEEKYKLAYGCYPPAGADGRNDLLQIAATVSQEELWYWCTGTATCNTGNSSCDGQGGELLDAARCVASDLFNAASVSTALGGRKCPCTSCLDTQCLKDYSDPSCKGNYQDWQRPTPQALVQGECSVPV